MKKSKLTLGLMTSMVSIMALAACSGPVYSPEGYILTYTDSTGETKQYTAEDLFGSYYSDATSVSTMFDSVYKLIVRNYFVVEPAGIAKYADIKKNAQNDVEGVKSKASQNADTNGTTYDVEFDKLLSSYSCKDESELLEHFIYERELKEFEDQFYDNNIDHLRDSKPEDGGDGYEGYLYKKDPYHVRHILAKVSDSSSTNFSSGTISEANARLLNDIATNLADSSRSFGSLAQEYSDDSSATSYGDLGIMDKDTSYVNEFKLGMYAFENIYNGNTKIAAQTSKIKMDTELINDYENAVHTTVTGIETTSEGINTIPYEAFLELETYAATITDEDNSTVNEGSENFYPRNVIYNKYLNKHSVAVITPNSTNAGIATGGAITDEDDFGVWNSTYDALDGFQVVDGLTVGDGSHNKVLCTKSGNPILVVRAGGDSYQGIHFMTIERTPLINEVDGVTLSQYYTTKYPGQSGYPVDSEGKDLQTYVNFIDQETKEYKTRAEQVESAIKGFDSNLNKYIYNKYVTSEKIKFADENLEKAISKWIESTKAKSEYDSEISWNETWETYINSLKQQAVARQTLISETCALTFESSTKDEALWNTIGGACNGNKK